MTDRELYQQKYQAQLDEWQAEIDKLKAQAKDASADTQLEMNKQITALEGNIEEGKKKLSGLSDASSDSWESMKDAFASGWDSLTSGFSDLASKFKN